MDAIDDFEVMFFIMAAFYIAIGIGLWELIWWVFS